MSIITPYASRLVRHYAEESGGIGWESGGNATFGPELVVNGDFLLNSDWIEGEDWLILTAGVGQAILINNPHSGPTAISQNITTEAGAQYKVSFDILVWNSPALTVRLGGQTVIHLGGASEPLRTYSGVVTVPGTLSAIDFEGDINGNFNIDNASVKKVIPA